MTITPDTTTQDNETVLKAGRKRIEYKCVFCALAEAKTEYKGDVTIIAPSEKTKVSRNVWPKERKRRCLSRLTRSLPTSSPSPMR